MVFGLFEQKNPDEVFLQRALEEGLISESEYQNEMYRRGIEKKARLGSVV